MPTLTQVSTEHRERLISHVEEMRQLADAIGERPWPSLAPRIADEHDFLVSTLVPHMQAVEAAVYPELDRLLSCRLAMAPMEREHAEITRLVAQFGDLIGHLQTAQVPGGEATELYRVMYRLYTILKVHLREESLYVPILEHNLDPAKADALVIAMDHAARVEL